MGRQSEVKSWTFSRQAPQTRLVLCRMQGRSRPGFIRTITGARRNVSVWGSSGQTVNKPGWKPSRPVCHASRIQYQKVSRAVVERVRPGRTLARIAQQRGCASRGVAFGRQRHSGAVRLRPSFPTQHSCRWLAGPCRDAAMARSQWRGPRGSWRCLPRCFDHSRRSGTGTIAEPQDDRAPCRSVRCARPAWT